MRYHMHFNGYVLNFVVGVGATAMCALSRNWSEAAIWAFGTLGWFAARMEELRK